MAAKTKVKETEEQIEFEEVGEQVSTQDFIVQNKKYFLIGGGALVAIILAIVGFQVMNQGKNTEASEEMFPAIYAFEQDSINRALHGDGAHLGFLEIAEEYSGTDAANIANYYIGISYIRQGDLESGVDYLESFSKSDNMLSMAAYMALGFTYEDLGDQDKAASAFEDAANTPAANNQTTPTMLLHAGRNYEAVGENAKALSLYETIRDEYPFSSEGLRIEKYIGRVSR